MFLSIGSKVAVVIDCFEVFIEPPSNLKARASTWSNYKHHNTVTVLLGITSQGVVSFIIIIIIIIIKPADYITKYKTNSYM